MLDVLSRFADEDPDCACDPVFEDDRLVVDAGSCPGRGDLAAEPPCRRTTVGALRERDAETVVTRTAGTERRYDDGAAALLLGAGRFAERVAVHDAALAERAARDPLGAAREATGRAGPVGRLVAETGLAAVAGTAADYDDALGAFEGLPLAQSRVNPVPPDEATLAATRSLPTGATVRIYDSTRPLRTYHVEPLEATLSPDARRTLAESHELLASGGVTGGERAPVRAVRRVAGDGDPVENLAAVLRKHTRRYGVLSDLLADAAVSDVFASAPVPENPLRVRADGETLRTNVRVTETGAETLASRFRRASGRAFSRASPTLDAAIEHDGAGRVRVAGVTEPTSDGTGFALRVHRGDAWTLPRLVAAGTLPADAAAVLSLATECAAAGLVAGTRGAGKTTLLGALLWELPPATRTVVLEDTPELPVGDLQAEGRDVQRLRTARGERGLTPTEALRAALRLGEGALVVGEVRGEEAAALYEAMRVGASGSAVLGTIHGDGPAAVRERVVADLGVPESSFAATDFVVTLAPVEAPEGRRRRVTSIAEVERADGGTAFAPLYEYDDGLAATGRIDRGNSALVADLAAPGESYADVRAALADRAALLADLAESGRTAPADVTAPAVRERRS
jgi:type IV secretory pathway ATPase VirB11/archaellum biosynthesis ATPase